MYDAVDYLYVKEASACDFTMFKWMTNSWRIGRFPTTNSRAKQTMSTLYTQGLGRLFFHCGDRGCRHHPRNQNSCPSIEGHINSAGTTAAPVHLAVGNELVAEGSAVVSAQTASTRGPGVQAVNRLTCLVLSQKSDRHKHPFPKRFLSWHGSPGTLLAAHDGTAPPGRLRA